MIKKISLFVLCFSLSFTQTYAQKHLGLEVGLNMSTFSETGGSPNMAYNRLYGLRIGAIMDFPVSDYISIQPGLLFSMMGADQPQYAYQGGISPHTVMRLDYMHIPLNILGKLSVGQGKLVLGGGPYVSVGVNGTLKTDDVTIDSLTYKGGSHGLLFGHSLDKLALVELGINLNIGYEFKNGLFFRLGYNYGLKPINNYGTVADRNTCIYISVGGLVALRQS